MLKRYIAVLLILISAVFHINAQDVTPPEPVVIDSVSVIGFNRVRISWEQSISGDVAGYYIYRLVDDAKVPIDTISIPSMTTYVHNQFHDTPPQTGDTIETYFVAPFDNSDNVAEMSPPHHTIFLGVSLQDCYARNQLVWNAYSNWEFDVEKYLIYVKINNSNFFLLDSVDGNTTIYTHRNLYADTTYTYYVRAIEFSGDGSSSSNEVEMLAEMERPPVFINANYASVVGPNTVSLSFYVDMKAQLVEHRVMRSKFFDGPWEVLEVFDFPGGGAKISLNDYINTESEVYYYKIVAINSCDVEIKESNIVNNIVLDVVAGKDLTNQLAWNNVEDWNGGTNGFSVFRTFTGDIFDTVTNYVEYETVVNDDMVYYDGSLSLKDKLSYYIYNINNYLPSDFEFTGDHLSYENQPRLTGRVCYTVRAYENPFIVSINDTTIEFKSECSSNTVCVDQQPRVWAPNAFTPDYDGLNDVFLPKVTFVDLTSYHLEIYNRWGELFYESFDPHKGWDGTLLDNAAPSGSYAYFIEFTGADGSTYSKSGHVTLIR